MKDPIEVSSGSDSPEKHAAARRSTLVSVAVNMALTVAQILAGILSHSQGLIADGIHSLSDLVADFVVLFANRHSQKAADADHHYGHHRYETAASLVLGALLLAVGLGMLWSALAKLRDPSLIIKVKIVALWVAVGALIAKELLFRYMLAVAERVRSSMLVANAWHARSDAASSLVVAVGIGGSLLGLPILDPIAALVVGVMVARMGWIFGWSALHDLMDGAVDQSQVELIRETLQTTPGVKGVHDLKTRKMGDFIVVDVHLEIDGAITVSQGHEITVAARERVMKLLPILDVLVHADPYGEPDEDFVG